MRTCAPISFLSAGWTYLEKKQRVNNLVHAPFGCIGNAQSLRLARTLVQITKALLWLLHYVVTFYCIVDYL